MELLRKKPENRVSVADALAHPWLQADVKLPEAAEGEGATSARGEVVVGIALGTPKEFPNKKGSAGASRHPQTWVRSRSLLP